MKTSTLSIRTPEGIVFSQLLAGPVTRFLAWFVDILCIGTLASCLNLLLGLIQFFSPGIAMAISILGFFIISTGYRLVLEWVWRGQTIGKRLFRLRVIDAEGLKLQFHQIVIRNLLRAVDMLPGVYFLGGIVCWLNPRCQRLGDIAANTVVIRSVHVAEPDLDPLLAGKYNSLREHPHLAARLRQRTSPAEAALALQALFRRDEFEAGARVELFEELASHFRSKVEFPSEATDGMAAEQYVRNVIDILYRAGTESRRTRGQLSREEKPETSDTR